MTGLCRPEVKIMMSHDPEGLAERVRRFVQRVLDEIFFGSAFWINCACREDGTEDATA